jgi:hypothetical protein
VHLLRPRTGRGSAEIVSTKSRMKKDQLLIHGADIFRHCCNVSRTCNSNSQDRIIAKDKRVLTRDPMSIQILGDDTSTQRKENQQDEQAATLESGPVSLRRSQSSRSPILSNSVQPHRPWRSDPQPASPSLGKSINIFWLPTFGIFTASTLFWTSPCRHFSPIPGMRMTT